MAGIASTAPGPGAVRRPHRRPPRRVRWPRRIGGILATLALLGVAATMARMVLPDAQDVESVVPPATAKAAPTAKKTAKQGAAAKKGAKANKLTAKQLAARAEAITFLRGQGYLPTREADYNPRHELRVLVGHRNGDPLGPRRAFFFAGERFIGHDTSSASSKIRVAAAGNKWTTLAYGVYSPGARQCCPSSTVKVKFGWDGASLRPVGGTIPASRLATG